MTKLRDPLSIDDALARIAGQVPGGWAAMAAHVDYHERTVRDWGDSEREAEINIKAAIALDLLFREHGGTGRPIYDAYGLLLGATLEERHRDQFALIAEVADLARESGEAEEALLRFAMPGATEADRRRAQKELLDAWRKIQAILALIGTSQAPAMTMPEEHSRAPP